MLAPPGQDRPGGSMRMNGGGGGDDNGGVPRGGGAGGGGGAVGRGAAAARSAMRAPRSAVAGRGAATGAWSTKGRGGQDESGASNGDYTEARGRSRMGSFRQSTRKDPGASRKSRRGTNRDNKPKLKDKFGNVVTPLPLDASQIDVVGLPSMPTGMSGSFSQTAFLRSGGSSISDDQSDVMETLSDRDSFRPLELKERGGGALSARAEAEIAAGYARLVKWGVYSEEELGPDGLPEPPPPKVWVQSELQERVNIKLSETATTTVLHITGTRQWEEDEKTADLTRDQNAAYAEMVERHKEKDQFLNRAAQTFNNTMRNKNVGATPAAGVDVGCMATTWDIEDAFAAEDSAGTDSVTHLLMGGGNANANKAGNAGDLAGSAGGSQLALSSGVGIGAGSSRGGSFVGGANGFNDESPGASAAYPGSSRFTRGSASTSGIGGRSMMITGTTASGSGNDASTQAGSGFRSGGGAPAVLSPLQQLGRSEAFQKALLVIEQAVLQNELHTQHMLYRDHNDAMTLLGDALNDGLDVEAAASVAAGRQQLEAANAGALDPSSDENKLDGGADGEAATGEGVDGEGGERGDIAGGASGGRSRALGASRIKPRLVSLWSFTCPLTAGKNVSSLSFNRRNQDLLAAGYGSFDFGDDSGGLICFWSLKNPKFPQKIIHTKSGVTSLDFCDEHPHLLAAGFYSGSVAIYDVRDRSENATLESAHATGKHSEPVWGIQWVRKEPDSRFQQLMSISSDGVVNQWSMKKGLVPECKLTLPRVANPAQMAINNNKGALAAAANAAAAAGDLEDGVEAAAAAAASAVTKATAAQKNRAAIEGISSTAAGMCFDFPSDDGTQYLAGTEGGIIHKCSISYYEQTLQSYYGHTGPVYKVKCSPFLPDAFITCSADWTCALWSQKSSDPILTFQSGQDYVMDLSWAPHNSCVFGSVCRDGRVEVWDLEHSPLDPLVKTRALDDSGNRKALSTLAFARNAPVVLTGSQDGSIDVYRVLGMHLMPSNDEDPWAPDQQSRLEEVLSAQHEHAGGVAPINGDPAAAATIAAAGGAGGDPVASP